MSLEIPANGVFFAYNSFGRGMCEDKFLIGGIGLIYFGSNVAIDKATSHYKTLPATMSELEEFSQNFWGFERLDTNNWSKEGLEPIRIKCFLHENYELIRDKSTWESYKHPLIDSCLRAVKKILKYILPHGIFILYRNLNIRPVIKNTKK
jgi:hypothetical protein